MAPTKGKKNASDAGEMPSSDGQQQSHRTLHRFQKLFSRKHGTAATAQGSKTSPTSADSAQPDYVTAPGEGAAVVLPHPPDNPETAGKEERADGAAETAVAADVEELSQEKGETRRDLWKEAVNKIDDGDRKQIALQESATGDALKAVAEIEKRCKQYKTSKEEKVLANSIKTVMRKTVEYAYKGKPLVDALVKVDKTGHAALAWSVVSFGLELGLNDENNRSELLKASGFLAEILGRYAIVENHYRSQDIEAVSHTEDRIVTIYAAILRYCAKLKDAMSQTPLERTKDAFLVLVDGGELKRLKGEIGEADMDVRQSLRIVEFLTLKNEIDKLVGGIEKANQRKEQDDAVAKLVLISTSDNHIRHSQARYGQTCTWIFDRQEYKEWTGRTTKTLWLYGPSGIGKSVLFSTIVNRLLKDESIALAYWYFDSGNSDRNTTHACLRSLAAQLIHQLIHGFDKLPKEAESILRTSSTPNQSPINFELANAITSIAKEKTTVIITLDALDECPDLVELASALKHIKSEAQILLTSQNIEGSEKLQSLKLELDSKDFDLSDVEQIVNNDVKTFVAGRVDGNQKLLKHKTMIESSLVKERNSNTKVILFRLAALQISLLVEHPEKEEVEEVLENIPKDMRDVYTRALKSLIGDDIPTARAKVVSKLIRWVYVARRKLTVEELSGVLDREPGDIPMLCPHSLIITPLENVSIRGTIVQVRTVQFAHSSVRDYFTSEHVPEFENVSVKFCINEDDAETEVAKFCLDGLRRLEGMQPHSNAIQTWPILAYTAEHWPSHVRSKVVSTEIRPKLFKTVRSFFSREEYNQFCGWLQIHDPNPNSGTDQHHEQPSQIYYAILLKFNDIVRDTIERKSVGVDSNIPGFGTMLQMAAFFGQTDIVNLLIDNGANPHRIGGFFGCALEAAAAKGYADIVQRLLACGAKADFIGGILGSPRKAAQSGGYQNVVDQLVGEDESLDQSGVQSIWSLAYREAIRYSRVTGSPFERRLIGEFCFKGLRREQLHLKFFIEQSHLHKWIKKTKGKFERESTHVQSQVSMILQSLQEIDSLLDEKPELGNPLILILEILIRLQIKHQHTLSCLSMLSRFTEVIKFQSSQILFDEQATLMRIYLLSGLLGLLGILGDDVTLALRKRVTEELRRLEWLLASVNLEALKLERAALLQDLPQDPRISRTSLDSINRRRDELNTLYCVLARRWQEDCCHPLAIKLLLAGFDSQIDSSEEALFELLVCHDSEAHHEWLEFEVGVGRPTRRVTIFEPARESQSEEESEIGDFCKLVESRTRVHGSVTHLRIIEDCLLRGEPSKPVSRNNESLSLGDILRIQNSPRRRDRSILNIFLVQAFLHLLGSPWLQEGLDKDHIFFSRREDGALDLRPYLSTRLGARRYEKRREILPHRSLVDLGILLLEVELWFPFELSGPVENPESAKSDMNIVVALWKIIKDESEGSDHVLRGARACLEFRNSAGTVSADEWQLLQEFYHLVLEPLRRDCFQQYGILPEALRLKQGADWKWDYLNTQQAGSS